VLNITDDTGASNQVMIAILQSLNIIACVENLATDISELQSHLPDLIRGSLVSKNMG